MIKEGKVQIRILKIKISKLEEEKKKMTDRLLNEKLSDVANDISKQCSILINEINSLERNVKEYEIQNSESGILVEINFPD